MKRLLPALLLMLAGAAAAEAGVAGWLTAQARSWDFIQQTGGLRIGTPVEQAGRWVLPVEYGIHGAQVTRPPTLINSGMALRKITLTRHGAQLVLRVIAQVMEKNSDTGLTHYVDLAGIPPGSYDVYYETAGDPAKFLGVARISRPVMNAVNDQPPRQ